jgi:hypothetical protein
MKQFRPISSENIYKAIVLIIILLSFLTGTNIFAQEKNEDTISNRSFDIAIKNTGISFGNSESFNGIRINAVDKGVQRINGLNFTFWNPKPAFNSKSVVNGIGLGIVNAHASQLNGIGIGTGVSGNEINGLALGVLGAGAEYNLNGVGFGGLGIGSGENLNGVFIGGLGTGSGGNVNGIALGGLGVGASGNMNGFFFGGLGAGAGGSVKGIGIGGLGIGAGENIEGIMIGGLGVGCGNTFKGLAIGGAGIGAGEEFKGVGLSLGMTKTPVLKGLAVSSYVKADESFGLSIAIFNNVKELHGVQLGLINYAGNNRKWLRVLPVINMHF